ncbi:hypothetical protein AA310_16705 [Arthrobacter sp. YC-RL1]|nr:hypothetical protein ATC04_01350 [Arthrobacter sp. YC-RL1]KLI89286.1 hypothetical protein AA310_16705 [Arthrobacter sp. YC-RL1]
MFRMSTSLKITVAACFTVGSIFTGANGLTVVSLLSALAAVIAGVTAVAEVSREARKAGFIVGIMASVFSVLGTAFVLTASTELPFAIVATIAAVPVLLWVALAIVHGKAGVAKSLS